MGLLISLVIFFSFVITPLASSLLRAGDYAAYAAYVASLNGYAVATFAIILLIKLTLSKYRLNFHFLRCVFHYLLNKPGFSLTLGLIFWVFVSSLTGDIGIKLLGSIEDYSDAAIYYFGIFGLVALTYHEVSLNAKTQTSIYLGTLFIGVLMTTLAIIEIFTGNAIFFNTTPNQLPSALFPGKGHLAGFLLLPLASALAYVRISLPIVLFVLSIAFVIGATYNRSSLIGEAVTIIGAWLRFKQKGTVVALLAVIALGTMAGLLTVGTIAKGGGERPLTNPSTLEARYYYWLSAVRGIAHRPVFGWGGGVYYQHWSQFLSDEELKIFFEKHGFRLLHRGQYFFLLEKLSNHEKVLQRVTGWKAHNQFLDVALMWGLPGLLLYLLLLAKLIKPFFRGEPAAIAVIAYHAFLLFWFMPPQAGFALAALWGIALAKSDQMS